MDQIAQLIRSARGDKKITAQELSQIVLDLMVTLSDSHTSSHTIKHLLNDGIEQVAKEDFLAKHGTLTPQSWQGDAYRSGSSTPSALRGVFVIENN
jgi:hypothetical protein